MPVRSPRREKLDAVQGWTASGCSRLYTWNGQRHRAETMFDNLFLQFVMELLRALLVDELSGRVRGRLLRWCGKRGARDCRQVILGLHRRNRDRLLHKLRTGADADL